MGQDNCEYRATLRNQGHVVRMEGNTDASPLPRVRAEQGSAATRDAAGIWARATAERDQLPVAPPPEDKLPGIESALTRDGALLLMVRRSAQALAFSIIIPRKNVLEVLYLAVDPEAWGTGIARQLLNHLRHHSVKEEVLSPAGRVERRNLLSC